MTRGDRVWVAHHGMNVHGDTVQPWVHEAVIEFASPSATEVVYRLHFPGGGTGMIHTCPANEVFWSRVDAMAWIAGCYRKRAQELLEAAAKCEPQEVAA